jgi:hypothetical protein
VNFNFPLYRKYAHDKTFFRINSKENFDELTIIGSFYIYRNQQAQIFPEFTMIIDMIENNNNNWIDISEQEFEGKLNECRMERTEKIF